MKKRLSFALLFALAAAGIALTGGMHAATIVQSAVSISASPAVTFAGGASSTGWINFDFYDRKRIFIPAKINGHDTKVMLATGLPIPDIDKAFAASIGLQPKSGSTTPAASGDYTAGLIADVHIQIGNMALPATTASPVDFAPLAERIGHSLPFLLGDDAFNGLVVDIDFAHHRIAFSDPTNLAKPAGVVVVPLTRVEGEHLVPVSIEGSMPAQFELGLGNAGETLVYQSFYEPHKLLMDRRTSQRLAGGTGGVFPEVVATLSRAEFAGVEVGNMPAAFVPTSQTGTKSNLISGDIGLPVLARFHLILDYSHDRLYAAPYTEAARAPFDKDRLGLALNKVDTSIAVGFVAPNSPAQAAGFKAGDKIMLIDGKSSKAWPQTALADLRYGAAGTAVAFTMEGGSIRQVKLTDYF